MVWLDILRIISAMFSTSLVFSWSFDIESVTDLLVSFICADCVLSSVIISIFFLILSLESIAISTIALDTSPVCSIACCIDVVIVFCSSMLVAVIFVAAVISFILLVTFSVVLTSWFIIFLLSSVSLLTVCDTSSISSRTFFTLSCSSLAEPTASSLNSMHSFPTWSITRPVRITIKVPHTALTSLPYIPFDACTLITIIYKINVPIAVLFKDFFS